MSVKKVEFLESVSLWLFHLEAFSLEAFASLVRFPFAFNCIYAFLIEFDFGELFTLAYARLSPRHTGLFWVKMGSC